jgi:F-type H+-transporting ATPase subunit epsilon
MSDTKILFELVSPAKLLMSARVDMVVVPGAEGDFGALAEHAPLISTIRPGTVEIHDNGRVSERIFVSGGFAEVGGNRITVLAEEALRLADITQDMVARRRQAASDALNDATTDRQRANAQHMMDVAEAMIRVLH